ncbi:MAG: DUF4837 family protein [Flavobacteriales bacterium]
MRSKTPLYTLIAVLITGLILFLISLDDGDNKGKGSVPRSDISGAEGEVVLTVPKGERNKAVGDTVAAVLSRSIFGLPRPEPSFDIVRVNRSKLTGILKDHRNIFVVSVSSEYDHAAKMGVAEDRWAKGQLYFRLSGNDKDSVIKHFLARSEMIIDRLEKAERERMKEDYEEAYNQRLRDHLMKKHSISLKVPDAFEIKKDKERFVWLERYRRIPKGDRGLKRDLMEGILIYYEPYKSQDQLEKEQLLQVRDSLLKAHVPGPSEGSYMITEARYPEAAPRLEEEEFKGEYAAKIRGLWRVKNDQMGGPFISLTTYDKERERLVTVEGFIYGPHFKKRNYLRELEAMLYTLEFQEKSSS